MEQDCRDVLSTALKRIEFLAALSEQPAEKRKLVDRLDVSRSTVNRGLWDLEQLGLVRYDTDRYDLTAGGRILYDQYQELAESAVAVLDADGLLSALPPTAPIDVDFLRDAEVVTATGSSPSFPILRVADIVRDADALKVVIRTHTSPQVAEAVREAVRETDGPAEFLLPRDQYEHVRAAYPWVGELVATGRLDVSLIERPPYSLVVAERDSGDRACLVVYEDERIEGVIANDDPTAVEWASETHAAFRERATTAPELAEE
jgi:predicted transcriptional regulator